MPYIEKRAGIGGGGNEQRYSGRCASWRADACLVFVKVTDACFRRVKYLKGIRKVSKLSLKEEKMDKKP